MIRLGHRLRAGPLPWLLALSAVAFATMCWLDGPSKSPRICGLSQWPGLPTPPRTMALAWLLMLTAMMPPLMGPTVSHVWISSLRMRRPRALALFGLGYALVWLAAGAVLTPVGLLLREILWNAGIVLLPLALAWSGSPAAQMARNRCHRVRGLRPFGWRADLDCLVQGLVSGVPCVAACWPWMLLPIVASDRLHLPIMAAVTVLLFLERLAPTARPVWRIPPSWTVTAALFRPQKVVGSW